MPAGASLGLTVVTVLTDWQMAFGLREMASLLYLLLVAVRSCPGWWATAFVGLCGMAVVTLPARLPVNPSGAGGVGLALLFPVMVTAGLGGYLRFLDHRRRAMVTGPAGANASRWPPTCTTSSPITSRESWSRRRWPR